MRTKFLTLIGVGIFVLLSIQESSSHPQCLDARPPFHAEAKLTFCPQYAEFGCCTQKDDNSLRIKYEHLRARIPTYKANIWARCSDYMKTFLCQTCSPYAAHIFDAEKPDQAQVIPRHFPGLCTDYCTTFYDTCREIVDDYFTEPSDEQMKLTEALLQGPLQFCKLVNLTDYDYCFPNLLENRMLNGNITIQARTQEGCLCVERFENTYLRNPIFARHANDGSNRLFIGEQIGMIHIFYPDGSSLPEPFLDMTPTILTTKNRGDERGLLGLAFHPQFSSNGLFYVYYSTELSWEENVKYMNEHADHKIQVTEYRISSSDPNKADPNYSRVILQVLQPWQNHNGGEVILSDIFILSTS